MKTINRILISSVLFALISIVSLLGVMTIVILGLLPETGKEMLDKDVFNIEEILSSFDATDAEWNVLSSSLNPYGYNLLVISGDAVAFSDLEDSQTKAIESLRELDLQENTLTGKTNGLTFVAKPTGVYSIFALKGAVDDVTLTEFLPTYLIISFLAIAVILLLSLFFTRKMAWRVLRPLKALSDGAKRIESGDLSEPIIHKGKDEFAEVATAFNHMQESLLEERKKTAAYEEDRTDLIAGISHDLRTPLTSVKGYIKGLRDGVANTSEKREQYLSVAYKKACDMDVLLQKLFYFSNLETGNLPLTFSNGDLGDFARRFADDMRDEFEHKNIKIAVDITSVPHPVKIDPEQMRRVLLNIMENAMKYANTKPLILRISVWHQRDMEHLLFADNGQGVMDEHLSCLFERFWRIDEVGGVKNGEGSGLGLYIVKYIVEAHGGLVIAKNDNGLQIKISLPCGKEENL
ncbi:HAMP domain-containing sensor histidine kinase [Clostridium botulinum]|uniref:HAMP domain-containing sensor histidine kinase n=1 Tax=Clostridium botulinum TaxID=1491 RepID=UPI001E28307A|nr:HAMP domain-containing sensor histidine kinase [Clostridium botulinum]MCC5437468.1 HAMP domain-containing histidine kinase [Clostridium botulinum]NFR57426.1 HAMP domain-containing histidine kinase [Clostridium botulinum]